MKAWQKQAKAKPSALEKAADLLARQEQSSQRLREKLRRRGYGAEETEAAIARLSELKYLDDEEACGHEFQRLYETSSYSLRHICHKLREYGFPPEMVQSLVPDDTEEREIAAALKCLARKYRPSEARPKMMRYLNSKGFRASTCFTAIEEFAEDGEEPEWD